MPHVTRHTRHVIYNDRAWADNLCFLAPLIASGDSRFPETVYKKLGFVGLVTMGWLSTMDKAMRLQRTNFFAACVRYEDLCSHRTSAANAVLKACGFGVATLDETAVGAVFDEDAHGNKAVTRSRRRELGATGPIYITAHDMPLVTELVGCHDQLAALNNVLPGTLSM